MAWRMRPTAWLAVVLAGLAVPAGAQEREGLDPHPWALASLDSARILVERSCAEADRCITTARLEWLAAEGRTLGIVRTVPIAELTAEMFVYAVEPFARPGSAPMFRLWGVDRPSGEPVVLEVEPGEVGSYAARRGRPGQAP